MQGYMLTVLHYLQHENPKILQDSPYPWTPLLDGKNNNILIKKHPADELDTSSKKCLNKMVGNLLYCAQAIDSTMLMSLNFLAAAQTKPTAETAKNITHF